MQKPFRTLCLSFRSSFFIFVVPLHFHGWKWKFGCFQRIQWCRWEGMRGISQHLLTSSLILLCILPSAAAQWPAGAVLIQDSRFLNFSVLDQIFLLSLPALLECLPHSSVGLKNLFSKNVSYFWDRVSLCSFGWHGTSKCWD